MTKGLTSFFSRKILIEKDMKSDNDKMEKCTLKNVNNCLNMNIYSYLETSGGKSYNLY